MKREKEFYNGFTIYEDRDSWMLNGESRIVKTRKNHICVNCQKDISKGSEMLLEICIDPDSGWCSAYTCADCVDQYVEAI